MRRAPTRSPQDLSIMHARLVHLRCLNVKHLAFNGDLAKYSVRRYKRDRQYDQQREAKVPTALLWGLVGNHINHDASRSGIRLLSPVAGRLDRAQPRQADQEVWTPARQCHRHSECRWTSHEGTFARKFTGKISRPRERTLTLHQPAQSKCTKIQLQPNRDTHFLRACAVEMHTDLVQRQVCTRIYIYIFYMKNVAS